MVQMRARVKKKETIEEMERELEQDKSWKKEEFHGADDEPEDESLEMEEEEGIHTLSAKYEHHILLAKAPPSLLIVL